MVFKCLDHLSKWSFQAFRHSEKVEKKRLTCWRDNWIKKIKVNCYFSIRISILRFSPNPVHIFSCWFIADNNHHSLKSRNRLIVKNDLLNKTSSFSTQWSTRRLAKCEGFITLFWFYENLRGFFFSSLNGVKVFASSLHLTSINK